MALIKARMKWDGRAYIVDLPTYSLEDTSEFNETGLVTVEVPDRYLTDGELDVEKVRAMYVGNPKWDTPDLRGRLERVTGNA